MELGTAKYTIGQIAYAAGVPANTARAWVMQHPMLASDMVEGNGPGAYARFTARTALHMALMAELGKFNVPSALSTLHASAFADRNSGQDRLAGECFADGETWLIVSGARDMAKVVYVPPSDRFTPRDHHAGMSILAVHCNPLVEQVKERLANPPVPKVGRPKKVRD